MAQLFPEWTNRLPIYVGAALLVGLLASIGLIDYYFSPKYTDVGYRPVQPVPYSHKLHAGDLGLDCRYCHTGVEVSAVAMVPPTKTCMNCHTLIKPESEKLAPIRESYRTGKPIEWIRVNKIPDFAYFDHSMHLRAGVGCSTCHGRVDQMEVVEQKEPLSMSWCMDCHRNPDQYLRRPEEVTNMAWQPPADQTQFAVQVKKRMHLKPPTDCSGCHR